MMQVDSVATEENVVRIRDVIYDRVIARITQADAPIHTVIRCIIV